MSPSPITKGGVMIGRMVRTRNALFCLKPVRVAISANARPSTVHPVAQRNASVSVFHATPQRVLPAMHPSPQIFSVNRRSGRAVSENAPALSWIPETRIRATGKKVKQTTSAVSVRTLPATNGSPLK